MSAIIEFLASLYDLTPLILIAEYAGGFCLIIPENLGRILIISVFKGLVLLYATIFPSKSSVSVADPHFISNS